MPLAARRVPKSLEKRCRRFRPSLYGQIPTLDKEKRMKGSKWFLVMALLAASVTAGCNTMHGAGEDIERGGEKIQENAR